MSTNLRMITLNQDEQTAFLEGNPMPKDLKEGYIWYSFKNVIGGVVYLCDDELENAAKMAEQAGLFKLAERVREAK